MIHPPAPGTLARQRRQPPRTSSKRDERVRRYKQQLQEPREARGDQKKRAGGGKPASRTQHTGRQLSFADRKKSRVRRRKRLIFSLFPASFEQPSKFAARVWRYERYERLPPLSLHVRRNLLRAPELVTPREEEKRAVLATCPRKEKQIRRSGRLHHQRR
jgi:hypothetical protein